MMITNTNKRKVEVPMKRRMKTPGFLFSALSKKRWLSKNETAKKAKTPQEADSTFSMG